jgi:pimeloyl-ACP methyl ester carboxylesterase
MTMDPAFREADGVKIRFAQAGQGGSETVVLTCPWPESLFAFRMVWDRLAEQFHVIAIDLPGFGQSEARLDLFSPPAMGAFLVQLVNDWDLGPVHFVSPDVGTSAAQSGVPARPPTPQPDGPPARGALRLGGSPRPLRRRARQLAERRPSQGG